MKLERGLGCLSLICAAFLGAWSQDAASQKGATAADLPTSGLLSTPGPTFRVTDARLDKSAMIVVYGDQRFTDPTNTKVTNPKVRLMLVNRIAELKPDAVLLNGDVPYSGDVVDDYAVYRTETKPWRDAQLHVYPALGNHEFHGDPQQALEHWWTAFPEMRNRRWYSVELGKSLYSIALDSDTSLLPDSDQARWLNGQLMNLPTTTRFVFINLHHPPVADIQTRVNTSHNPRPNEIALRDYLEKMAPNLRAKLIVSAGHIHNYERFQHKDVTYLVAGGGAASPVPVERTPEDLYQDTGFPNYHYVEFAFKGKQLEAKMYRLADAAADKPVFEVKDTFTITAK